MVDLNTGDRTIISDAATGIGPVFNPSFPVVLDATKNRAILPTRVPDALVAIDLITGDRNILSGTSTGTGPVFIAPEDIVLDVDNNRLLVVDGGPLDQVFSVDLSTGNRTIFSDAGTGIGSGEAFITPKGIVLDPIKNRALVPDHIHNALFSVDLSTGDRSILSADGSGFLQPPTLPFFGAGPSLGFPESIALDTGKNRALLIGGRIVDLKFVPQLVEVDLSTGNRNILSDPDVGTGPLFRANSVALDEANNRAFVVGRTPNALAIVSVDLNPGPTIGNRTIFSDSATGTGPEIAPFHVMVEAVNNRVLVSGAVLNAFSLVAIDLNTAERTILSGSGRGAGPGLGRGIALDTDNNRVFMVNTTFNAVVVVELGSGDRVIISR